MYLTLCPDQLDSRHLRAVALAVTSLENARVAALAGRELRTDFLKQFVRRRAMGDVTAGETTVVEGACLRLGDQLLDEWTQLLCLRLGGLDGATLNQRLGETSHQG